MSNIKYLVSSYPSNRLSRVSAQDVMAGFSGQAKLRQDRPEDVKQTEFRR